MVGRGEKIYLQLLPKLFWEVRPAGMTDHPKEASLRGNCWVHALRVERERAFILWQERSATTGGELKPTSVWQGSVAHTSGGRQVRTDQTEAVKGQNGKTMVTAGTIKRLLPCPVKGG